MRLNELKNSKLRGLMRKHNMTEEQFLDIISMGWNPRCEYKFLRFMYPREYTQKYVNENGDEEELSSLDVSKDFKKIKE